MKNGSSSQPFFLCNLSLRPFHSSLFTFSFNQFTKVQFSWRRGKIFLTRRIYMIWNPLVTEFQRLFFPRFFKGGTAERRKSCHKWNKIAPTIIQIASETQNTLILCKIAPTKTKNSPNKTRGEKEANSRQHKGSRASKAFRCSDPSVGRDKGNWNLVSGSEV